MWVQQSRLHVRNKKGLKDSIDESLSLLSNSVISVKSFSCIKFKCLIHMLNGLDYYGVGHLLLLNPTTWVVVLCRTHWPYKGIF